MCQSPFSPVAGLTLVKHATKQDTPTPSNKLSAGPPKHAPIAKARVRLKKQHPKTLPNPNPNLRSTLLLD